MQKIIYPVWENLMLHHVCVSSIDLYTVYHNNAIKTLIQRYINVDDVEMQVINREHIIYHPVNTVN